jgi:hypothetical protein
VQWLWVTAGAALALSLAFVLVATWLSRRSIGQGTGAGNGRLKAADFSGVVMGPSTAEALARLERQQLDQQRSE